MMDLSWLPSAIMQTTGALLGLHVVIYIFLNTTIEGRLIQLLTLAPHSTTEKVHERLRAQLRAQVEQAERMKKPVNITIFLGCLTILANAVWLDSFTTHILSPLIDLISVPGFGGIISLFLFILFLSLV